MSVCEEQCPYPSLNGRSSWSVCKTTSLKQVERSRSRRPVIESRRLPAYTGALLPILSCRSTSKVIVIQPAIDDKILPQYRCSIYLVDYVYLNELDTYFRNIFIICSDCRSARQEVCTIPFDVITRTPLPRKKSHSTPDVLVSLTLIFVDCI
jgi:hypothetical protein